jgi:hypothetical protein
MFLLIILILGVLALVLWRKVIVKYDLEELGSCIIAVSIIFAVISMITYAASLDTIATMEAFHERNYDIYTQAVEEFPNSGKAITKDDSTIVITLPYDRVKLIVEYNEDLTWYKRYQNHFFVDGFVGKVPGDLGYIVPEKSGQ